jgi:glycosyltransferase involved in cell wall biosynthesis
MESVLRIGIIAHLKHPIGEPFAGGLEMHTHMLQSQLVSRGHAVTIFASTHSDPGSNLEPICDETSISEVGLAEAPDHAFFQEHHAYLSLMNRLRLSDFDIIHNNSLHYLPVAMADVLPMPIVTTLHTPPFSWLESGIRLCRSPQASFVAVSNSIRISWTPVVPISRVILNGIDLNRFRFQAAPDSKPYLVWCGRIVPEKGLHFAIAACRAIGAELRIAGPISDEDYFEREIRPSLSQTIVYLGHLKHEGIAALVGGARASLCTPCWDEPYGLVVAEALACGVPVAAFARGAIPELLDATCGILANKDDVASLAQAAKQAQTLDRAACRAMAERSCDVSRMIDDYEALYRQLSTKTGARSLEHFGRAASKAHIVSKPRPSPTEVKINVVQNADIATRQTALA